MTAWYLPREIVFNKDQMKWIIEHLPELREGQWPVNPRATGYVDESTKTRKRSAYFETPCQIASEADSRMGKCGLDGLMIEALYCWGEDNDKLCRYFKIDEDELMARCRRVLNYISGWKRKRRSYEEFCGHKKATVRS